MIEDFLTLKAQCQSPVRFVIFAPAMIPRPLKTQWKNHFNGHYDVNKLNNKTLTILCYTLQAGVSKQCKNKTPMSPVILPFDVLP